MPEVAAPRHWRLETDKGPVHVWAPARYDRKRASTVVYLHGYHMNVDEAWGYHDLPTQFEASGIDALFIAPEGPKAKRDPVVWLSLHELIRTVETGIGESLPAGRVSAVAYSGGRRTLDYWLPNTRLETILLHDAMYGVQGSYAYWLRASPKRRLLVVGDDTISFTDKFFRWIGAAVRIEDFDRLPEKFEAARKARTVYVRSSALGHWELLDGGLALPAMLTLMGRELQ